MENEIVTKRRLSPRASYLLSEREGARPVWIRAPARGTEFFSGLTRPSLYTLAAEGRIKSASLRRPGTAKGTRLWHLQSILDYLEGQSVTATNSR